MRFTYCGVTPDSLANGRPLALGDEVDLTPAEREANARLIREGALLRSPSPTPKKKERST